MRELADAREEQEVVLDQLKASAGEMRKAFALMDKDVSWVVKKELEWSSNIPAELIPTVKEHEAKR